VKVVVVTDYKVNSKANGNPASASKVLSDKSTYGAVENGVLNVLVTSRYLPISVPHYNVWVQVCAQAIV